MRIHTEHNVDYEQGITDGQLSQQLICAINTGMSFYEQLNDGVPGGLGKGQARRVARTP